MMFECEAKGLLLGIVKLSMIINLLDEELRSK